MIYKSYLEASEFAIKLGIKSKKEWDNCIKNGALPKDIYANPARSYKEWGNWGEFLKNGQGGNGRI